LERLAQLGLGHRLGHRILRQDQLPANQLQQASLSVCIPWDRPTCITEGSWNVFPSRIRLETAPLPSRISMAGTRPPPIFLQSVCATDALQRLGQHRPHLGLAIGWELVDDPVDRGRSRVGVQGAEDEMPGLRGLQRDGDGFQVAHLADQHHVGSSRSAARSAALKLPVWTPTSRWWTRHRLCEWTNSMGSSTVMTWSSRLRLM